MKQAVLLIHGIGEQKPMDSLRGFVRSVWTNATGLHGRYAGADAVWSKPYNLSATFELRRLTTPQNSAGIRTDFFELYWAHQIHGTMLTHVFAWARSLLLRSPSTVPRQLRLAYGLILILLVIGAGLGLYAVMAKGPILSHWMAMGAGAAILPAVTAILVNIVGDAARYLHPAPTNVQRRNEIRKAGVEVLKSLHEPAREYDRIIVVGHSLGSVIGFDIINHTWLQFNEDTRGRENTANERLQRLEAIARDLADGRSGHAIADIQAAQRAYLAELRSNGSRWRVTDFVTMGCPLAHADVLLARDRDDFNDKVAQRELAQCLPTLEISGHKPPKRLFSYPSERSDRIPHHAAPFAPTRWTNLYFPSAFIIRGDIVGGPLAPLFGAGVKDVPVKTAQNFGFFSHTLYWRPGRGDHIAALADALDLADSRKYSVDAVSEHCGNEGADAPVGSISPDN